MLLKVKKLSLHNRQKKRTPKRPFALLIILIIIVIVVTAFSAFAFMSNTYSNKSQRLCFCYFNILEKFFDITVSCLALTCNEKIS